MSDELQVNTTEVSNLPQQPVTKVFRYQRDVKPSNVALSAESLKELFTIVKACNERSKEIEFNHIDKNKYETEQRARDFLGDVMRVEYNYTTGLLNRVRGIDELDPLEQTFPDDISTMYISNSSYPEMTVKTKPLNCIDIFLAFDPPTLKIDVQSFPSNPTVNRSIINVYGGDEDWVISTAERIRRFFDKNKSHRPFIHESGSYDYALFFIAFPVLIWLFIRPLARFSEWISTKPTFINVIVGIYCFLAIALFYRFIFQYVRWLFPPMEYYKSSRVGSYVHRIFAGTIMLSVIGSAFYDLIKMLWSMATN